jgi:hypothetical protein
MGLVLSYFQDGFRETLRAALLKLKINDRLGMIGSFILIDLDDSGMIDRQEFICFGKRINPMATIEDLDDLFDELDIDRTNKEERGVLNIKEFVEGIEKSSHVMQKFNFDVHSVSEFIEPPEEETFLNKLKRHSDYLRWTIYPTVSSKGFDTGVLMLLALQIFILSAYGSTEKEDLLDILNGVLVLCNTLDVLLKVFVYRKAVMPIVLCIVY